MSSHYVPDTILGTWDISMNKANKSPCPDEAYILIQGERQFTAIIVIWYGALEHDKCYGSGGLGVQVGEGYFK